ncbi:MAG: MFS transporter, partial [Rhodobacteraceae bacterium]|nr:MFS transporter [Paracoccaceae bacterium]
ICDPLMGILSDNTRSRWGRRRPYLFAGSILCGITFMFLFRVPGLDGGTLKGVYVGIMYTVASTAFSIYSVPYLTMGSELATTPHQRTVVMSWRQVGLGGGLVLGNVMPLVLVDWGGGGETGYAFMGIVLGLLTGLTMMITFIGTASVPTVERSQAAVPLGDQLRLAARNKPFLVLLAGNFLNLVGSAAAYATLVLFVVYRLEKDFVFTSRIALMTAISVIVTPPLWTMLAKRIGKKATFMCSIVMFIATYLSYLLLGPDDEIATYALSLMMGTFNCGFSLIAFSMLLDTIDFDRRISGLNREGVYSGVWSAMDKTAFAFGALLAGLALQMIGFHESAQGFAPQNPETIRGIGLIFACTPALFATASMIAMTFYRMEAESPRAQ